VTEHSQLQQTREATGESVTSLQETNQTLVDSIMAIQELNVKLAQRLFLNWIEMLTPQPRQTTQEQQDPFQALISDSMQLYVSFLFAPLTLSRNLVEASMAVMQSEREKAQ
jgi:hypothetical protein